MTTNTPRPSMIHMEQIKNVFRGMVLLGKGKAEGINFFSQSGEGILNALAPWIACSLVANIIIPLSSYNHQTLQTLFLNLGFFLTSLCNILLPLLIIHFYAKLWKRENLWIRIGSAYLWCNWLPIIDFLFFMMVASILFLSTPKILATFMVFIVSICAIYSIWLMWFCIFQGLGISKKQSSFITSNIIVAQIVINGFFIAYNYQFLIQYIDNVS